MARLVRDAFRLAFFQDVPAERLALGWGAVLAIALATLVPSLVASFVAVGTQGEWTWFTLPFVLVHLPLILAAAIVSAYAIGRPGDVPRLFAAGLLASVVVDVAWLAATAGAWGNPRYMRSLWRLSSLPAAWLALAMAAYAARSIPRGGRRMAAIVACAVLVGLPLGTLYRDRSFWQEPYRSHREAAGPRIGPASEEIFYRQPEILARELAAVGPRRAGAANVFLVAVAGYGNEDVFMREVDAVARLFRERFGAEGHVVRLVNNPRTLLEAPIASRTSLARALDRVGHVMDRDQDVLVLFMTSHGSENHHFALQLWPMQFNDIDPSTLRRLLDQAGIRNRVIIISTCYSGGYVPALANPDTLVITAAASDRTSFGCGNEFQWTYFGDAYFNDALRRTHSFTQAFEMARPAIEARERKEGFEPSQPQIAVGAAIAPRLARLQEQLDAASGER